MIWEQSDSHIEKLRMADEWIPAQRRVELYVAPHVPLLARHPCKYHHYPLCLPTPFPSSPIIFTPKSPHFLLLFLFPGIQVPENICLYAALELYKHLAFTRISGKIGPGEENWILINRGTNETGKSGTGREDYIELRFLAFCLNNYNSAIWASIQCSY